jgi:Hemerythrin HHE cation binding domain
MSAKEPAVNNPNPADPGIRRLAEELNREDSQLRSYLLDAALAGLRLTRSPESPELRRDAARIWAAVEPILSHHLEAESSELLPWLEQQGPLSPEVGRKVRGYHDQLRTLIGLITSSGKGDLSESEARQAGQALTGLAVYLDDAISDEEDRLFPTIRKALFGIASRT